MTDIFRAVSPPFFTPSMNDFASLRRVKPLPKRRRTSDAGSHAAHSGDGAPAGNPNPSRGTGMADFSMPSYYYPLFPPTHGDSLKHGDLDAVVAPGSVDLHSVYRGVLGTAVGSDEDDHLDGDYVDHLQQPGNTKKRKVPAAHEVSSASFDDSSGPPLGDDARKVDGEGVPSIENGGGLQVSIGDTFSPVVPISIHPRRIPTSVATLAGLKYKEMLKNHKRQVMSIIDGLTTSDSLALDQALSAALPWYRPGSAYHQGHRTTSYRRVGPAENASIGSHLPEQSFTFFHPSPTTDRLIATREEVALLKDRFEKELARQAATAAEAARLATAANSEALAKAGHKSRTVQRKRTAPSSRADGPRSNGKDGHSTPNTTTNSTHSYDPSILAPVKGKTPKKKKRSALANASNPHHLRNYVPSRLPNSGPPSNITASQAAQNFLGPPPIRLLMADLKPRGRANRKGEAPNIAGMPDEWICSFCEYDLFYGSEASFRRAVRSRKKILRRRRRARERAARAASGVGPVGPSSQTEEVETEEEGDYDGEGDTARVPPARAVRGVGSGAEGAG